ncbi:MAG: hypothetical protein VX913_13995 [Planctomycetota bacterium]|nr:hypothetical protein [Planctomycetota bacterium]
MRRFAVAMLLCAASVSAQPLLPIPGGSLVFTESNPPAVNLFDPLTLSVTPLTTPTSAASLVVPSGICVSTNRDIIFGDFTGVSIYRIDALGTMTTLSTGLLNNVVRLIEDYNGDIIYTGNALIYAPSSVMRLDTLGLVTTVAVLVGNPFAIVLEPTGNFPTGDYVITLPLQGELQRVDPAGGITTLATGMSFPTGVAHFPNGDYAVAAAGTDDLLRVPAGGGTPTVWVPGSSFGNIKDVVADGQGGFYVSEAGGLTGNRLQHVDAGGNVSLLAGNGAFSGLYLQCANVAGTVIAPAVAGTGLNGLWGLTLDFPGNPGGQYQTFMSGTVYPGISFGADPRGTPLNFNDPLFQQSFGVGFPGITAGWIGGLSGSGSGAVTMNLTPFPSNSFAGIRLHFQVAILDPMAQSSLARISNLCTLVFQ